MSALTMTPSAQFRRCRAAALASAVEQSNSLRLKRQFAETREGRDLSLATR